MEILEEQALWLDDSTYLYHEAWSCRSCHAEVNLVLVSMGDVMSMMSRTVACMHVSLAI